MSLVELAILVYLGILIGVLYTILIVGYRSIVVDTNFRDGIPYAQLRAGGHPWVPGESIIGRSRK